MSMKKLSYILLLLASFILLDRGIALFLQQGLNRYFGLGSNADILMIGHSHLMLALDKEQLESATGLKVAKCCREGVNVFDRQQMVRHYLDTCSRKPRYVLYGVDPFLFTGKDLSANSYKLFYPFIDEPSMNEYIRHQSSGAIDYWQHKLIATSRYSDALIGSAIRGWLHDWSNKKYGHPDEASFTAPHHRSMQVEPEHWSTFLASIEALTKQGIHVILVNTPVSQGFQDAQPEAYRAVCGRFEQLASSSPLISYLDYNPDYDRRYALFYDLIHLNDQGQKELTQRFLDDFSKLVTRP